MSDIDSTLQLLEEGAKRNKPHPSDTAIVFIGPTGAGKSTTVGLVAGDNNKLTAVIDKDIFHTQTDDDNEEECYYNGNDSDTDEESLSAESINYGGFCIVDEASKISRQLTLSETLYPDTVVEGNAETSKVFIDCPGFSDTRDAVHEIAATVFIKQVFDWVKHIKIVFVVSYGSVNTHADRGTFIDLLGHLCKLLKNITKYAPSIAMIVTKVENSMTDRETIAQIANFLRVTRNELPLHPSMDEDDKQLRKTLISILLTKHPSSNTYTNISIIRKPLSAGCVAGIPALQENRKAARKMLFDRLRYTESDPDDFSPTVSTRLALVAHQTVEKLKLTIMKALISLDEYYFKFFGDIIQNANDFQSLKNTLERAGSDFESLKVTINSNTVKAYLDSLKAMNIILPQEVEKNIVDQHDNLKRLQSVIGTEEVSAENIQWQLVISKVSNYLNEQISWVALVQKALEKLITTTDHRMLISNFKDFHVLKSYLTKFEINFEKSRLNDYEQANLEQAIEKLSSWLIEKSQQEITASLTDLAQYFLGYFEKEIVNSSDYDKLQEYLEKSLQTLSEIENHSLSGSNAAKITALFVVLKNNYNDIETHRFRKITDKLDFLKLNRSDAVPVDVQRLFADLVRYLDDSLIWYTFIRFAFKKLLSHQVQSTKTASLVVSLRNWNNFRQYIREPAFNVILGRPQLKEHELTSLNQIITDCFQNTTEEYFESSNELIFKGNYILISDIAASIVRNSNLTVYIFALHTVCINQSLNLEGKRTKIVIIAPKIECVGNSTFNLNGVSAVQHAESTARTGHGLPGQPGGSAGSLLCVSDTFVNRVALTVAVTGGNGGSGQNGCAGVDGTRGQTASCSTKHIHDVNGFTNIRQSTSYFPFCITTLDLYYGKPGQPGTDGGNGGKGRKGGCGGEFTVINLDNSSLTKTSGQAGRNGVDGQGGRGGSGGKNGNDVEITTHYRVKTKKRCCIDKTIDKGYARNGSNGIAGHNGQHLDPDSEIKFDSIANILIKYKTFLLNAKLSINHSERMQFYKELNENTALNGLASPLDLVNEFKVLEQLFTGHPSYDWPFIYGSFLRKIEFQLTANRNCPILQCLCSSTLGKIIYLQNDFSENMIVDLDLFLTSTLTSVSQLRGVHQNLAITQLKNSFQATFNEKISEGQRYVTRLRTQVDDILPAIHKKFENFKTEVDAIIAKINGELQTLHRNRATMEHNLLVASVFGVLKTASSLDDLVGMFYGFETFEGIQKGLTFFENYFKESLETVDTNLLEREIKKIDANITKELLSQLQMVHDSSGSITDCLQSLEDCLQAGISNDTPFDRIERGLSTIIASAREHLSESDDAVALQILNKLELMEKCLLLTSRVVNAFKQIDHAADQLNQISAVIRLVEDRISLLTRYANKIDEVLRPMLRDVVGNLNSLTGTLENASAIPLLMSKREIRDKIEQAKGTIVSLTQGFTLCSELVHVMDTFDELLTTILTIYDRVDGYRDQANLVGYIANINLAEQTHLTGQEAVALLGLKQMILQSFVLVQYKRALNAFQQWIFPFAPSYLGDIAIEFVPMSEDQESIDRFLQTTCEKLGKMKDKIRIYRSTIDSGSDTYIQNLIEDHTFYQFPCDVNNRSLINSLLQGDEVAIKTKVQNGPSTWNGVKFNEIKLRLKTKNQNDQSELNVCLRNFEISMKHLGSSYYKCNERVFLISSSPQEIEYSFDGTQHNEVYAKLMRGDFMLSPFTMWKFKLSVKQNGPNDRHEGFKSLDKFHDNVELELVGKGSYIKNGCGVFNEALENYYLAVD